MSREHGRRQPLFLSPKKTYVREMKKFRPVALTSILCKCLEKVVAGELTSKVAEYLDPLQCAYKPKRGVEDASLTLLNTATRHLDLLNSLVRILFMDFTSAFYTLVCYWNVSRDYELIQPLYYGLRIFFKDRPQHVWMCGFKSNRIIMNRSSTRLCVIAHLIFYLYTRNQV